MKFGKTATEKLDEALAAGVDPMEVSLHGHSRRLLIVRAVSCLLDAMIKSTAENGEMTAMEWLEALSSASRRFINDGMQEEWTAAVKAIVKKGQ